MIMIGETKIVKWKVIPVRTKSRMKKRSNDGDD